MAIFKRLQDLKDIKWPKRKDNPFQNEDKDANSRDWVSLRWLSSQSETDDVIYAEAYKRAGDVLINHITCENNRIPSDIYFLPIAFMYRHCIELKLKKIVKLGLSLQLIQEEKHIQDALRSHKLIDIWKHARNILQRYFSNDSEKDIRGAAGIIEAVNRIDKSGYGMRYPTSLEQNPTLSNLPESASLLHLQNVFEALFNFLDGGIDGLIDGLDQMTNQ